MCPGWARLRSRCLLAFYPPALWSFPGGYHSLAGRHVHAHINIKGKYEPSSAYANNKWSLICRLWVWSIMFSICCLRCHRDSVGVCVRIKHPIFIQKDCFMFWHKKLMQKKQTTNTKFLFQVRWQSNRLLLRRENGCFIKMLSALSVLLIKRFVHNLWKINLFAWQDEWINNEWCSLKVYEYPCGLNVIPMKSILQTLINLAESFSEGP